MLCYSDLNKYCKIMKKLNGIVHSLYTKSDNNLGKIETDSIQVMLTALLMIPIAVIQEKHGLVINSLRALSEEMKDNGLPYQ